MNVPYWLFQAKLFPRLPFLIAEAKQIRGSKPNLPPLSEKLILDGGEKRLMVFGESTAAGVGASQVETTLAGHFKKKLGDEFSVYCLGKNGLRVQEAKDFFHQNFWNPSPTQNGITLFLGANDCFKLTSPKDYHRQLSELIYLFKKKLSPAWIYLADIPPVHLFPAFSSRMQRQLEIQRAYLQKEMKSIAQRDKDIYFEPISLDLSPDFFSQDQIHPSDLGYQKIAEFTIQGLKKSGWLEN
ncbi:SGNH/GDSL hydrolase family protein [Algoriphagus confluentis]|uniref:SGNH hydrolase-type esterase domain-containing protein n=1 Tax=Algoriphagus confluentis TaxID=1697556 RepID=A0ABQ6PNJ9_9BACT|nr:hypothetical protein Aconfl_10300 [Algoriphagus confluentis]